MQNALRLTFLLDQKSKQKNQENLMETSLCLPHQPTLGHSLTPQSRKLSGRAYAQGVSIIYIKLFHYYYQVISQGDSGTI